MSYFITYNSEENFIEIKVQGDFTLTVAKEIVSETMRVAKEQNCFLVLNDMREASLKLSTLDIQGLPITMSDMSASLGLRIHKFKRAFVAARDLKDYKFFETVTINRAHYTKLFFDVDEAKKWLSEK